MSESVEGSVEGVAPYGLLRDETRQDGERGTETSHLSLGNAHASSKPKSLAYLTPCRYCGDGIYVAMCRDGRWRSFDIVNVPAAEHGVWAWRKKWGMEEQALIAGKRLHFCARYDSPDVAPWDRGRR